ncbi:hypothetical protein Tco_0157865 [Tanacetum coccineum]
MLLFQESVSTRCQAPERTLIPLRHNWGVTDWGNQSQVVMSADSVVIYTSVHVEANRSWSISSGILRGRLPDQFFLAHDTHDAPEERAAVRAEIEVLRRERLAYEQEGMETRQALARSEAHCRALEARVTVLETEARPRVAASGS